jgi:hypothetical protein
LQIISAPPMQEPVADRIPLRGSRLSGQQSLFFPQDAAWSSAP